MVKLIDPLTGLAPVIESGQMLSFMLTVVEDAIIPDGVDESGEGTIHVYVEPLA